ncbi:Dephospho-CoA kinase [Pseudoruegeria aquimaris]|uniref:Dephospho-CoA kinase n=1 Tax=Pseudoruegeria aquimaris TaxID=393663 RepID=A0A1Y5RSU1_9RHOB|nr:dephospho-CoA kinase [Pseudoruegeria aquimaris]SLN24540.1 Dephospho-CoA kinase [Pseudoruegeria aquimaris]
MTRPFLIGLTGSIGMGKSTTAEMFAEEGAAVWDADAAVHRLYARGGAAVAPMQRRFPGAVNEAGVDRGALKELIAEDPSVLKQIEAIVHPLVAADRAAFIAARPADVLVLDIPLLFETGSADQFDLVAVVSAPPELQRARVLARPGMTAAQFETILAKQLPDAEKRARADVVIPTETLEGARKVVREIMAQARGEAEDA